MELCYGQVFCYGPVFDAKFKIPKFFIISILVGQVSVLVVFNLLWKFPLAGKYSLGS